MKSTTKRIVALMLGTALCAAPAAAAELDIPAAHPRLWFSDAARLAQAQAHFAGQPFTPGGEDAPYEYALRHLLTGNIADCAPAIGWLMDFTVANPANGANDPLRWHGEQAMLIYDWCHAQLTPVQRQTLIERWNGYVALQNEPGVWGGRGMEANNYWWGHVRNSLEWGIVSYHDNAQAQGFIDHALDVANGEWWPAWFGIFGRGGVAPEGGAYGSVMLAYPAIPFDAATRFGAQPYAETPFFRHALYHLIYASTPAPTIPAGGGPATIQLFPFNDDELFVEGGVIAQRSYLGDGLQALIDLDPGSAWAGHARAWMNATGTARQWLMQATASSGAPASLDALPLDYYAPGSGHFYVRTARDAQATVLGLQLASPGGIGHFHEDAGSFQLWRGQRWLTRETTGYSQDIAGFNNGAAVDVGRAVAHNTLLFEGRGALGWNAVGGPAVIPPGTPRGYCPDDLPRVIRLHSADDFAFAATDLSLAYRARYDDSSRRVDWPYSQVALREFVFVRPLRALIILDRTTASGDSLLPFYAPGGLWAYSGPQIPADQVRKSFVLHTEQVPVVVAPGRVRAVNGDQVLDLSTLLPAAPVYRVIAEGGPVGQQRIELDATGAAESYFLNVLHARAAGEAELSVALADDGTRWTLSLSHPVLGNATVVLEKGMSSAGGSVRIGDGPAQPLYAGVQGITVAAQGPVWSPAADPIFADDFDGD